MPLQLRRGTDTQRTSITPAVGEPVFTTDTKQLYIGDGTTVGGVAVGGGGGGGVPLITQAYAATEGYGPGEFTAYTAGTAYVRQKSGIFAVSDRAGVMELLIANAAQGTFASLGGFRELSGSVYRSGTSLSSVTKNTVTAVIRLSHLPTTSDEFRPTVCLTDAPDPLYLDGAGSGTLGVAVFAIGRDANWKARFTGADPFTGFIASREVNLGVPKSLAWTKIQIITEASGGGVTYTVKLNGTTVYTTTDLDLLNSSIDMSYILTATPQVVCAGHSTSPATNRAVYVDHFSILSEVTR